MKKLSKIQPPPPNIAPEAPTPVQFLPSALLAWRAPIILRREPVDPQPPTAQNTGDPAR